MRVDSVDWTLYVVTDGKEQLEDRVGLALEGGTTCVQFRDKREPDDRMYKEAAALFELCKAHQVPFFVNDHIELAQELRVDGIHLGQDDIPGVDIRALAQDYIVGISAKTAEEAIAAENAGAHYIGVGACFPTGSKDDASYIDLSIIEIIRRSVSIPIVLIGGINGSTLPQLAPYPFDGIAVISAVLSAADPQAAAQQLKSYITNIKMTKGH
jgi:thiamine-phosphate pyrophosphorylase